MPITANVAPEKDTWLFVRGLQSIHVSKLPGANTLLVCGPGHAEHSHHFDSEQSLADFWGWYKRHLLGDEWVLTPDRRTGDDQGTRPERRRTAHLKALEALTAAAG
jgi:hypothetical protein